MGLTKAERERLRRPVLFIGETATGKEGVATAYTRLMGGHVLLTGITLRALADTGLRWMLIPEMPKRLGREAVTVFLRLLRPGRNNIFYEPVDGDRVLHIRHGREDLTARLHHRFRRAQGFPNLEPAAAKIASNTAVRESMVALWRRTVRDAKTNVMAAVVKKPLEVLPEARLIVHLFADDGVSARYRFVTGANVCDDPEAELAYIRHRNETHRLLGLDVVPERAYRIDMTGLLLKPGGLDEAASMVFSEYGRAGNR